MDGMKVGDAIAEIMKREGIDILCGYPVNHLIEYAAKLDIRPVMVRQERIGLHMADAISRVTSGKTIGAFCMQHGPGTENAYGGVAQCYGESVPVLVLPMGYARRIAQIDPNYRPTVSMASITKSAETINLASEVPNILRRAFSKLRNGRGGPVLVEIPTDMWNEEVPEPLSARPPPCSPPPSARSSTPAPASTGPKPGRNSNNWQNSSAPRSAPASAARAAFPKTTRSPSAPAATPSPRPCITSCTMPT
jgi:thiamine pyrophosphate-dependent acetolactate synthase large subunit-like protein